VAKKENKKDYIFNRLKEPSTWRGFLTVAVALGLKLTPDQQVAIISTGLALIGLIGVIFPDKIKGSE
jgi:uncharacterized protein (DUF934 family)